jgi:hypothetical protein
MDLILWRHCQIRRAVDMKSDGAIGHQLLRRPHSCRRWNKIYLDVNLMVTVFYFCIFLHPVMSYHRILSRNFPEGLKKTIKFLCLDSRCPGRDSNRASPKYKSRALRLHQPAQLTVFLPNTALSKMSIYYYYYYYYYWWGGTESLGICSSP